MKTAPQSDEIEVTVFGPGYGECIVVHFGDGRWIVIDSCKGTKSGPPAALVYFKKIGIDVSTQVELIVFTHWHDDHIRGATELLDACPSAGLCFSEAFTRTEFRKFLSTYSTIKMSGHGSGVDEFANVFARAADRTRKIHRGGQDKRILNVSGSSMSHSFPCEVWTLSPSGSQVTESEARFASEIPPANQTMRRALPGGANNHSVASWVRIGDCNILLGADLETTADVRGGWDAVHDSTNRPNGEVGLFKVPHHGSETGHHTGLWANILVKDVNAIVTPWNRNNGLPGVDDLKRLNKQTKNLHLTSMPSSLSRARHEHKVERMMRDFGIRTKRQSGKIGAVTARIKPNTSNDWVVDAWDL